MRVLALVLLALPALFPAGASAQPTLNKCIDAQGKVTYSNLPCRNAREARKVEIAPAPLPDPVRVQPALPMPAPPAASKAANRDAEPAIHLETRRTLKGNATAKPASARQCDALADKLGRVFDKMDAARRKGYTQEQMDAWNAEVKELERKKQQSACF
ncbi:DUF4124 domain-containing protein [Thiobacillus denitrificans]|jgi:hypothetical protein|uniref:DUF4124 domain-containing protein n=1 Tax=Thiobacillus denitrificans TaxID=36861 RepID=UPI0003669B89|nr:DUF4124 domain-containing protein [Thiobacillus denitrificans]